MENDIVKTVNEIAARNGLSHIEHVLKQNASVDNVNLVFLGEFSSGKTSLINALVNTTLPVGTKPTTKAICMVRPTEDVDNGRMRFYSLVSGAEREVDAMTFGNALLSEQDVSTLCVEVPACDFLPRGVTIVDTPGEGSISSESSITMAYLSQVDASIFCVRIGDGTLHQHVLDFVANPALAHVRSRMIFALTMADVMQSDAEIEKVRQEVVNVLKNLCKEGRFDADNLEQRVIPVSTRVDSPYYARKSLLTAIRNFIFDKRAAAHDERVQIEVRNLLPTVVDDLKKRLELMTLDVADVESKVKHAKQDAASEQARLSELESRFDEFRALLPEKIGSAFDANAAEFLVNKDEEQLHATAQVTVKAINDSIKALVRRKLKMDDCSIDNAFASKVSVLLPAAMQRIENVADGLANAAFIALSAGLAGFAEGGATAAEGAARGAAATAAKQAGTAAKTVSGAAKAGKAAAAAAKTTSKTVDVTQKAAAEAAEKSAKRWATLGKVAGVAAKVIDSLNPASYVRDMVSPGFKEREIARCRQGVVAMADDIADALYDEYVDEFIRPAQKAIKDGMRQIEKLYADMECQREELVSARRVLKEDIAMLEKML